MWQRVAIRQIDICLNSNCNESIVYINLFRTRINSAFWFIVASSSLYSIHLPFFFIVRDRILNRFSLPLLARHLSSNNVGGEVKESKINISFVPFHCDCRSKRIRYVFFVFFHIYSQSVLSDESILNGINRPSKRETTRDRDIDYNNKPNNTKFPLAESVVVSNDHKLFKNAD